MAETPTGWLKPDDLSDGGTTRRALRLLGDYLDEDQQRHAETYGGFLHRNEDRYFWLPLEGSPWCAFADDGRVEHYCIAPDKRAGMPDGDVALTYLLWIKLDASGFLREANLLSTKQIEEWPDSEDELAWVLAVLTRPPVRRRPRPRKVKEVKPRGRKNTELSLDAVKVQAIFARHGKAVPADILRKLTR